MVYYPWPNNSESEEVVNETHYKPSKTKKLVRKLSAILLTKFILPREEKKLEDFDKNTAEYQGKYCLDLLITLRKTELGITFWLDKKIDSKGKNVEGIKVDWKEALNILRDVFPKTTSSKFFAERTEKSLWRENILWPGIIEDFWLSSWTTSVRKIIPAIERSIWEDYRKAGLALQVLIWKWSEWWNSVFAGETLSLCWQIEGSASVFTWDKNPDWPLEDVDGIEEDENRSVDITKKNNNIGTRVNIGDISAYLSHPKYSKDFIKRFLLSVFLPFDPDLVTWDFQKKREIYINELVNTEVTQLYWVSKWQKDLLRAIWSDQNKNIEDKKNWKPITEVLPNLKVVVGWWVDIRTYLDAYEQMWLSPKKHLIQVYNATEWLYAAQAWTDTNMDWERNYWYTEDGKTLYRLLPSTHVAEFVKTEDCVWGIPKEWSNSYFLHELTKELTSKTDKEWNTLYDNFVFMPTAPGLPRILMDTVTIRSINPFRFTIEWRADSINLLWEEFHIAHAVSAMNKLSLDSFTRENFCVTIAKNEDCSGSEVNRHERLIEMPENLVLTENDMKNIVEEIDMNAQESANDYKVKRNNWWLDKPVMSFVPNWAFSAFEEFRDRIWWQFKIATVTSEREKFLEVFLRRAKNHHDGKYLPLRIS